ncbi:MAG: hypothetical protein ACP5L5_06410 [Vulcanisaeta sp.]
MQVTCNYQLSTCIAEFTFVVAVRRRPTTSRVKKTETYYVLFLKLTNQV